MTNFASGYKTAANVQPLYTRTFAAGNTTPRVPTKGIIWPAALRNGGYGPGTIMPTQ
jgi:hypothetical protein